MKNYMKLKRKQGKHREKTLSKKDKSILAAVEIYPVFHSKGNCFTFIENCKCTNPQDIEKESFPISVITQSYHGQKFSDSFCTLESCFFPPDPSHIAMWSYSEPNTRSQIIYRPTSSNATFYSWPIPVLVHRPTVHNLVKLLHAKFQTGSLELPRLVLNHSGL